MNFTYVSIDTGKYALIDTGLRSDCGFMQIISQNNYVLKANPTCSGISKYSNQNDKKLAIQSTLVHEIIHLYDVADITSASSPNYSTTIMGYGCERNTIVAPTKADLDTVHAR